MGGRGERKQWMILERKVFIFKKRPTTITVVLFYLYNIKYILFYAFYVLHYTFRGYLKYVGGNLLRALHRCSVAVEVSLFRKVKT